MGLAKCTRCKSGRALQGRVRFARLEFILSAIRSHWRVFKKEWWDVYPWYRRHSQHFSYASPSNMHRLLHFSATSTLFSREYSISWLFIHHFCFFLWSLSQLSTLLELKGLKPNPTSIKIIPVCVSRKNSRPPVWRVWALRSQGVLHKESTGLSLMSQVWIKPCRQGTHMDELFQSSLCTHLEWSKIHNFHC